MASNESILDQDNTDLVQKTIKIQSYVRRWLVQKMVAEIKQLYEDIVKDLDGQETEVVWPRNILSYPSVWKAKLPSTSLSVVRESSSAYLHNSCQQKLTMPLTSMHNSSTSAAHVSNGNGDIVLKKQNLISTQVQTDSQLNDLDFDKEQISSDLPLLDEAEKENVEHVVDITNNSGRNIEINLLHFQHTEVQTETNDSEDISGKIMKADDLPSQDAFVKDDHEKQNQFEQKLQAQNKAQMIEADLPHDKDQLLQFKSTVAIELLWVQQAINSRKQYLRLKQGIQ
ncbi:hypothetical protein Btru_050886 [Bulinus truncatus]|nr:hypothetical protein Btru_050886 [Bulinus truncatus]